MNWSYYDSPIGQIKIEAEGNKITLIKLLYNKENKEEKLNKVTEECKKQLDEYFNKKRKKFNLEYKLQGTDFQCKVWSQLAKIRYGDTVSYKDIAIRIEKEKAVRAVANAIGSNKLLILIPCHRIIGSNGKLTGFSAKTETMNGLEIKEKLLGLEQTKE